MKGSQKPPHYGSESYNPRCMFIINYDTSAFFFSFFPPLPIMFDFHNTEREWFYLLVFQSFFFFRWVIALTSLVQWKTKWTKEISYFLLSSSYFFFFFFFFHIMYPSVCACMRLMLIWKYLTFPFSELRMYHLINLKQQGVKSSLPSSPPPSQRTQPWKSNIQHPLESQQIYMF